MKLPWIGVDALHVEGQNRDASQATTQIHMHILVFFLTDTGVLPEGPIEGSSHRSYTKGPL